MRYFFILYFFFLSIISYSQVADSTHSTLSVSYDYNHFQKQFADDWHVGSLEYKHQYTNGAILGRINYGNRLHQSGWQGEVETYPVLSKKVYAFAGIGYADKLPVFPKWRFSTSIYTSLPKAWEVEGGLRYLYFNKSIWIGTVGLSKYIGNWLFNIRSYLSLDNITDNQSYFVAARRYFKNEKDYVWLELGSGISPDESRNIQIGTSSSLSSKRITAGTRFSFSSTNQLLVAAGWASNEYIANSYDHQLNLTLGLSHRFKGR